MQNNNEFPPLLHLPDVMALFGYAENTVRKRIAEARTGKSRFSLPLDMGKKKGKLLWTRESIVAFLNNNQPQASQSLSIESSGSRSKRHRAACEALAKLGVSIAPNGKEVTS